MNKWIYSLMLITSLAFAGTYTRQADSTIVDGLKINASDLNAEFDAIQSSVNSIDTTNILDGSLTFQDYAATSSAYILNRKYGCETQRAGTSSVTILQPCELALDGKRSVLSSTSTITFASDLDTGSGAAGTFYYIYGADNSGDITFQFSTTAPDYVNARKKGDTTERYIGVVRTLDSSIDIIDYKQNGERFEWLLDATDENDAVSNIRANRAVGAATSSTSFTMPRHQDALLLKYEAFGNSFPAQCTFQFTRGADEQLLYQAMVIATGNSNHVGRIPFPVYLDSTQEVQFGVTNGSNCTSGRITIRGFIDPPHFHR